MLFRAMLLGGGGGLVVGLVLIIGGLLFSNQGLTQVTMDDLSMWEDVAHGSSVAFILAVIVALITGRKALPVAATYGVFVRAGLVAGLAGGVIVTVSSGVVNFVIAPEMGQTYMRLYEADIQSDPELSDMEKVEKLESSKLLKDVASTKGLPEIVYLAQFILMGLITALIAGIFLRERPRAP